MKVKGVSSVVRGLATFGQKGKTLTAQVVQSTAMQIQAEAKQNAPVDLGALKNSIVKVEENEGLRAKVEVGVSYGAYQEFGTGGFVFVPKELTQEALKFKGKAQREGGIKPQPYLYPAWVKYRAELKPRLAAALNILVQQANAGK